MEEPLRVGKENCNERNYNQEDAKDGRSDCERDEELVGSGTRRIIKTEVETDRDFGVKG